MSGRGRIGMLGAAGVLALAASAAWSWTPRLVWNASASAPIGVYVLSPAGVLRIGDRVAVQPPPGLAAWLDRRHALPTGAFLIKSVAALAPSEVCRTGDLISVDGAPAARARTHDRQGRRLPAWRGCRGLSDGEVLLLNPSPDSLDGRYFGPLPRTAIVGRLIWLGRSGGAHDGL